MQFLMGKLVLLRSSMHPNHAAKQGRLHYKAGSWSAGNTNLHQWLEVDLGSQYIKVTRVATQGRNDYPQWVTKYKLQYSNDGVNFQYYREQGKTVDKVKLALCFNLGVLI